MEGPSYFVSCVPPPSKSLKLLHKHGIDMQDQKKQKKRGNSLMLTATIERIYQLSSSVRENGDSWIALRATISLVGLNRHPYFYFRVTDTDPSFFTNDPDFYRDWFLWSKTRHLNWRKAKPVIKNPERRPEANLARKSPPKALHTPLPGAATGRSTRDAAGQRCHRPQHARDTSASSCRRKALHTTESSVSADNAAARAR